MTIAEIERQARAATSRILDLVLREGRPIVLVDSPPGAGKTRLIEDVVGTSVNFGLRVAVVTPKAEQAYDFVRRVRAAFAQLPVQLLQSRERLLPDDLARDPAISVVNRTGDLAGGPGVVISTIHKLAFSMPEYEGDAFDLLICDEAYQAPAKTFHPLFGLARQVLLVGDPGQLPPLVLADTHRFEAAPYKVHWPIPSELLERIPNVDVVRLPATRRLPPETAELIQPGFYPDLPFVSAARSEDRRLGLLPVRGRNAIDRALDQLAGGASIVRIELPARNLPGTDLDEEVAETIAEVVARLLARRAVWVGQRQLTARDIGCADPHVASGAAIRRELQRRRLSPDEVMVDTPEIWQGLERPVMVVKHPLSGRSRLSAFDLEPGRWCVMLSRHQVACVVVGREGIGEALTAHQHDCSARPLGAENAEWLGWQAHVRFWEELERRQRIVRVD